MSKLHISTQLFLYGFVSRKLFAVMGRLLPMTAMEILKSEGPVWRKGFFRMTNISQRPSTDGRDRPLYGNEYGRIKFGNCH